MSYSYVALDIETANDFRGSICSIGMAKFKDGQIVDTFYSLINPEEQFDDYNIFIHGITSDDVMESPTFPDIRQSIIDFIGSDIVVAHYAQFDMGAIKDVYKKYQLDFDNIKYICSYRLAKVSLPGQLNYKLNSLAKNLNITLDHHNALSDAQASGLILNHLLSIESCDNLNDFLHKYRYDNPGLLGKKGFRKKDDYKHRKHHAPIIYQPTDDEKSAMDTEHPFYDQYFCFTGKLERLTRNEAHKKVALVGGIPENSVTKHTNILVVGEPDLAVVGTDGMSSKMKKAQILLENGQDIEIMTENDFTRLLEM